LLATKTFYTSAFRWEWIDYGPTYAATTGVTPAIGLNGLAAASPLQELGSENSIGPFVLFSTNDLEATRSGSCCRSAIKVGFG
jgi:predicted enzyme related to lactoylglutathione lyase